MWSRTNLPLLPCPSGRLRAIFITLGDGKAFGPQPYITQKSHDPCQGSLSLVLGLRTDPVKPHLILAPPQHSFYTHGTDLVNNLTLQYRVHGLNTETYSTGTFFRLLSRERSMRPRGLRVASLIMTSKSCHDHESISATQDWLEVLEAYAFILRVMPTAAALT
ncbi:hypothetical protein C8R44DRAFT_754722 [Mycena epipterygia]|nr:hypothetical protein C8R44DRAFT_754722 [Mycena epipterygia]